MKTKLTIAVSLLLLTSCQKERCWMCYERNAPMGALVCDKTRREIKDLESVYKNMGIDLNCEVKK
jgi:hypothetical protein